jgi:hypothetical protein
MSARQYHAVEPENRLIARTLERTWGDKLQAQRVLEEEYRRHRERQPRRLTVEERETIRSLATDLATLWSASTTTPADRKAVLLILIDRVVAAVEPSSRWVDLVIRWAGGRRLRASRHRDGDPGPAAASQPRAGLRERALAREGRDVSHGAGSGLTAHEEGPCGGATPSIRRP